MNWSTICRIQLLVGAISSTQNRQTAAATLNDDKGAQRGLNRGMAPWIMPDSPSDRKLQNIFKVIAPPPKLAPSSAPSSTSAPQLATTVVPSSKPTATPVLIPSQHPSVSPTLVSIVKSSISPSVVSSESPSTSRPSGSSSVPSSVPSQSPSKIYIDLQFSLYSPHINIRAVDVLIGKVPLLLQALKVAISYILCMETDFQLVDDTMEDICNNRTRRQESGSVLRNDLLNFSVKDIDTPALNYTLWTIQYPVMSVGQVYIETAMINSGSRPLVEDELLTESVLVMERVGQLALMVGISSGQMDSMLPNGTLTSVVTMESETFLTDTQVESTQALNPPAMNALRVAGIVIFVSMFVLSTVLVRLARRRKKERESDDQFKEFANGGLVTEEGLNYILDIGRGSQLMHATNNLEEPENPDDDLRNIPLPEVYMNVADSQRSPQSVKVEHLRKVA